MDLANFPVFFGLASYGGLACSLLAAGAVALFALRRHRGTPRQLAGASLACLAAAVLMLAPLGGSKRNSSSRVRCSARATWSSG